MSNAIDIMTTKLNRTNRWAELTGTGPADKTDATHTCPLCKKPIAMSEQVVLFDIRRKGKSYDDQVVYHLGCIQANSPTAATSPTEPRGAYPRPSSGPATTAYGRAARGNCPICGGPTAIAGQPCESCLY